MVLVKVAAVMETVMMVGMEVVVIFSHLCMALVIVVDMVALVG